MTADSPGDDAPAHRPGWRRVVGWAVTALACLPVLFALPALADLDRFTPGAFLRIPLEGLLGSVLVLVLPARARRVAAVAGGLLLGLLVVVKFLDVGFDAVLYRPFDPVLDWSLFGPAVDFPDVTVGRVGTIGAVVLAVVSAVAAVVLTTLSVLRLTRLVDRHRLAVTRVVVLLAVAWITCAGPGLQLVPGVPVASGGAAAFVRDHARQVRAGLRDRVDRQPAALPQPGGR